MAEVNIEEAVEKVRAACLKRGVHGIKSLGRTFKIFDDDRSHSLSMEEFRKGMNDYGVGVNADEIRALFMHFDKDGSGTIIFDEFLVHIRPPMSKYRLDIIELCFNKADRTGDGVITVEDMKKFYNATKHPKYTSGEWTERRVFQEFLNTFQQDEKDDKVTKQEFINYYSGVSASIDENVYFDYMMRNAWKI